MSKSSYMAPITEGKVISASFGSIKHLKGSKMIDQRDSLISEDVEIQMTVKPRIKNQVVYASEKVDGMCAAIYRKDNKLYPLVRRGYDARTNPNSWIRAFGEYVADNSKIFMSILGENERVVGEWMIKQHTVKYDIRTDPFLMFDIIRGTENQTYHYPWAYIHGMSCKYGIDMPKIARIDQTVNHIGCIDYLRTMTSSADGEPEGVVLRLEENGEFVCMGKYVSHPHVGDRNFFMAGDPSAYNILEKKYQKYYPHDRVITET